MSLIKIFANDIELDFVKDTLSIKKENNALIRDFKVSYNSIPFLIIENANTAKALGSRDLTSINKTKTIAVTIEEGGQQYYGELQILTYINGFRKCNLKYATALLSIMNKKISEFMPIVSVIPGETSPEPYVEKETVTPSGFYAPTDWLNYPVDFIDKGFPDVKWQFPTMRWADKFGADLTADDEWLLYEGYINKFNETFSEFIENSYVDTTVEILSVANKNVPSPQIYLLAPLFYALEANDFKVTGDFYTNAFIKKLLFLSAKNNLCETILQKQIQNCVFTGIFYSFPAISTYEKSVTISNPVAGDYTVEYSFTFAGPLASSITPPLYQLIFANRTGFSARQTIFEIKKIEESSFTISGSETITIPTAGTDFCFLYCSKNQVMPTSYTLNVVKAPSKTFHQMHPTIETGRYLPDWTFGTYLNALQNFFNLDIAIDDFSKKMTLNFNQETIDTGTVEIIRKSLEITSYEQTPNNAFLLKMANDTDTSLWITTAGSETFTTQTSKFSETLEAKFKLVDNNQITAKLSDDLISKDGVGLMIYNEEKLPYISESYSGQTLNIDGAGGIYETYWKKWLKFRLNSSSVEMSGPFTETELSKILKVRKIYIDYQLYMISSIEYQETQQQNFNVKLELSSITF